jgi:hypothetical protein
VDLNAEILRYEKKLKMAQDGEDKLLKLIAKPDYESSVPQQVQAANKDKVIQLRQDS